jgi:hypothetical protein
VVVRRGRGGVFEGGGAGGAEVGAPAPPRGIEALPVRLSAG